MYYRSVQNARAFKSVRGLPSDRPERPRHGAHLAIEAPLYRAVWISGPASTKPREVKALPIRYDGPTVVGQSTELVPSQFSISLRVTPRGAGSEARRAPSAVVIDMKFVVLLVHWLFVIIHF